ncbi:type VI secretion system protein TssA [Rhizobium paknamense]|uniref:Type VI secretion system protein ImpA n=1 Tax=Rhizobium paknamense TaxID=1206817 RepID=A0ABU0IBC7_9HYPH|nr:type VI secretion system protein TssA [Rhizobium paknamense]MDQ0454596.1 type VI secretion system protein ImpA [Rhizobium paknamense]
MGIVELTNPIEKAGPCGNNIRVDADYRELYYRIKDARNQARAEERNVTPDETAKASQEWNLVSNLGLQIVSSVSKDIEVLAWLAEAHLRLRGFEGLAEIYGATTSLLSSYWDEIHSIDDDDIEEKLAPFAGLNGFGTEGTLIQPLRLVSLIPQSKFGEHSLWDFQLGLRTQEADRREAIHKAATEAGVAAMTARLSEVNRCLEAFNAFNALLTEKLGQNAPPSSNIRNVLMEIAAAMRSLGGRDEAEIAAQPVAEPGEAAPAPVAPAAVAPVSPEGIASREDAFETLLNVARYFRRTEPHSPISLAIETLVRRGRMDFSELLAELLPEPQARQAVLIAAGIKPARENGN